MFRAGRRSATDPFHAEMPPRRDGRASLRQLPWPTLAVIMVGGVLGALARQGLSEVFPHHTGAFDWTILGINAGGCALIGVLMTIVNETGQVHHLTRPFFGVGVLGGFTTFSTYIVDIQRMLTAGAPQTALAYLALTLAGAMLGVYTGVAVTRSVGRRHQSRSHQREES